MADPFAAYQQPAKADPFAAYQKPLTNGGASDDWSTGSPLETFQRFTSALGEGRGMEQAPSDAEIERRAALPIGQRALEMIAPLNPLNIVRGLAQPVQEMKSGKIPEGFGHAINLLSQPGGPKAEIAPFYKGAARAGLKVASSRPAMTAAGAGVGHLAGHGIPGMEVVGGLVGREVPAVARRVLTRMDAPSPPGVLPGRAPAPMPIRMNPAELEVPPSAEIRGALGNLPPAQAPARGLAPLRMEPTAPPNPIASRFPERAPELAMPPRAKPITAAPPESNTITAPETAPARDLSPQEATSRSRLAEAMAKELHKAGASVEDVAKLSDTDPFWQTLETKARPGEKATRNRPPSPDTVQLVREHHQRLMAQPKPLAAPSNLRGRSLDLARQLSEAMDQ